MPSLSFFGSNFVTFGVFGLGLARGGTSKNPELEGLKFAKCGPISVDFRPFLMVFRQNGGQNYSRFQFFLQIQIPRHRLIRNYQISQIAT